MTRTSSTTVDEVTFKLLGIPYVGQSVKTPDYSQPTLVLAVVLHVDEEARKVIVRLRESNACVQGRAVTRRFTDVIPVES